MSTFGETLRRDRERLDMTQEQFGKLLGVSQQTVANWETGQAHPRQSRRQQILEVLGPESELARNPPRTDFIPAEARPVSFAYADGRLATPQPPPRPIQSGPGYLQQSREQTKQLLAELGELLPEPLRKNVGRTLQFGQAERPYHYASDGVIARFMHAMPNGLPSSFLMHTNTIRLAIAVDHQQVEPAPKTSVVLFVISPENSAVAMRKLGYMAEDAALLGITVSIVRDMREVAEAIAGLEEQYAAERKRFEDWLEQDVREWQSMQAQFDPGDLDLPPEQHLQQF